jgi:hypothetical protein
MRVGREKVKTAPTPSRWNGGVRLDTNKLNMNASKNQSLSKRFIACCQQAVISSFPVSPKMSKISSPLKAARISECSLADLITAPSPEVSYTGSRRGSEVNGGVRQSTGRKKEEDLGKLSVVFHLLPCP